MKNEELIKFFILAVKNKYPNVFSPKRFELVTPTQFNDEEMQGRWLGFQLCYEHLGDVPSNHQNSTHQVPGNQHKNQPKEIRAVYDGEIKIFLHQNRIGLYYEPKDQKAQSWAYTTETLTMQRARALLQNILHAGRINLAEWKANEEPFDQNFLIGLAEGRKSHVWSGNDTYCKAWSQNGLKPSKYKLTTIAPVRDEVCQNCIRHLPRAVNIQFA